MAEEYIPRMLKHYREEVRPKLRESFGYDNIMEVPHLAKISINMGLGEAKDDPTVLEKGVNELTTISGQKAVVTRSKKSISNFNIREGQAIGARVTLRGAQMYEFLDKFIALALPRVRDFNGVSDKSFDGSGNYSIGVKEQIIFPEIDYDEVEQIRGMDVTFVTTAETDEEAYELFKLMGMPFRSRASEAA
ncbi:MAG: 50S ribosomal protein L5 [Candidatus Marinimicrobia bacterium]|nr:50S ribosomal protein L5 [Candidatus Neomarinimicrobiota bacterium]MCF7827484.1 50S ribosomal protein L5 [Candidatus Neomarinimicrobiota bacterium]MCF7882386.1 50S ribosomal protein L5 [Candidatus Neomarinimicrobiota bacterium]